GVASLGRLPWLVVALPAGALVDRLNRGRFMRWADAVRAVVLAAVATLVVTDRMTIGLIYGFVVVLGVCDPFFAAASQAVLPELVPVNALVRANGLLFVGTTATQQTVGAAIGG